MKLLLTSDNLRTIAAMKSSLAEAGIAYAVHNESSPYPGAAFSPEVWVLKDDDFASACALRDALTHVPLGEGRPWKCASCGEELEGQFGSCWNCGANRPSSGAEIPMDVKGLGGSAAQAHRHRLRKLQLGLLKSGGFGVLFLFVGLLSAYQMLVGDCSVTSTVSKRGSVRVKANSTSPYFLVVSLILAPACLLRARSEWTELRRLEKIKDPGTSEPPPHEASSTAPPFP